MLADATTADRSAFEQTFDACVIGAGPAGITLARRLAAQGLTVALMEAGGLEITEESQDAYRGTNVGMEYFDLDICRLRYFGGTSNHWGGWSRALEAVDFKERDWVPLSGWPIEQLDPRPLPRRGRRHPRPPLGDRGPEPPRPPEGLRLRALPVPLLAADPFRREIPGRDRGLRRKSPASSTPTSSTFASTTTHGAVTDAVFRTYDPAAAPFTVKARAYALCTGGIENARLLLNFTAQAPDGIGNTSGWVGRCFADHPHFILAECVFRVLVREREFYQPTELFMEEHGCLNFGIRLEPRWIWPNELPTIAVEDMPPEEFNILLDKLVRDPFVDRSLTDRLVLPQPPGQTGVLRTACEAVANPDSRVTLSDETDAFGLRRVALDWRLSAQDVQTMRTAVVAFGAHMAEQNIGRLQMAPWLEADAPKFPGIADDEVGGKHHLGTTRMSSDPETGVVDRNCRLHEVTNLYIGGSSVFASTGHCNPTYTIVQLALRLGDHLGERLRA